MTDAELVEACAAGGHTPMHDGGSCRCGNHPTPAPGISEERLQEAQAIEDRWRAEKLDIEAIEGHALYVDIGDLWCELLAEVRRLQQQVERIEDLINNGSLGMEAFDLRLAIDAILGSSHG